MAFENLYLFVDRMAKEYEKEFDTRYLIVLVVYHDTVLSHSKFKSQRLYCEKKIFELNPSFFEGYFKRKNP